jgi:RES domain-containing protein
MIAYRIADGRHAIFDATGAMLCGGRWNSVGLRAIYAAESFAGALLEILVHANASAPPKHHRVIQIFVPEKIGVETVSPHQVKGWDEENMISSRAFGDLWLRENRSAVLRVPSVPTQGREYNVVFNPAHPEFSLIRAGEPEPLRWDARLFR